MPSSPQSDARQVLAQLAAIGAELPHAGPIEQARLVGAAGQRIIDLLGILDQRLTALEDAPDA